MISNDSDLALPVEVVRNDLKLPVGVVFPCSRPKRYPSVELRKVATFTREIREAALGKCLFPDELVDAHGKVRKPGKW